MLTPEIQTLAADIAAVLLERGETVAVAEGSCGGLVSAALLSVPGASAYYVGGAVIYTGPGRRAFLGDVIEIPPGLRGATEVFARYAAQAMRARLGTTWAVGEGGAAGPSGNPYGDPPGHAWLAVSGPVEATRHVLTGDDERVANMTAFTTALLALLLETIRAADQPSP